MKKKYNVSTKQNGKWVFWSREATEADAKTVANELATKYDGVRVINKENGEEIYKSEK